MIRSAVRAWAVTPSDTIANDGAPAGVPYAQRLFVGGAGNVTLVTTFGDTVEYQNVPAGTYLYVMASFVKATGTSATNIVAEYIRAE